MVGDSFFDNAFPDLGERYKYSQNALVACAKDLKYPAIRDRLKKDNDYSLELAKIVRLHFGFFLLTHRIFAA